MTMDVAGIALMPIIVALVGLAKMLGMPHDKGPLLNAALSVLGVLLVQFVILRPGAQPIVVTILQMVIAFLTAAGLYREVWEKAINREA